MYIEDFEKKFRLVIKHATELNELYNKLYNCDSGITDCLVLYNPYCDKLQSFNEELIKELFGTLSEEVFWYLDEINSETIFGSSSPSFIEIDGVKYEINNIENFMDYIRHGVKLPQKPVV